MTVFATLHFVFTDDSGEPLHPVLDRRCLAEPFSITAPDADTANENIEQHVAALQVDIKEYINENADYMSNEGCYGFQGIVHTDTILDHVNNARPEDIGFGAA